MQLSKSVQRKLAEEFRTASDRMKDATDLQSKLYLFSSFFGAINRALNEEWSNELALLHHVLQGAHRLMSGRLAAIAAGAESPIQVPKELPDRLTEVADKLADIITADRIDDSVIVDVLAELSAIAYSTTGNGYYLYLKGNLKV